MQYECKVKSGAGGCNTSNFKLLCRGGGAKVTNEAKASLSSEGRGVTPSRRCGLPGKFWEICIKMVHSESI